MKSFLRSAAAVVLALLLVAVPVSENIALATDPVTATVTVATSGSLGAGLGAVATSPVTATVGLLVLGALGVNAFVSANASAQGETKTEWISRKMQEYAEIQGSNYAQLEKDIAYNTYVTSDGILHLQRSAAEKIKSFGDWLIGGGEAGSVPVYDALPDFSLSGSVLYGGTVVSRSDGTRPHFQSVGLPIFRDGERWGIGYSLTSSTDYTTLAPLSKVGLFVNGETLFFVLALPVSFFSSPPGASVASFGAEGSWTTAVATNWIYRSSDETFHYYVYDDARHYVTDFPSSLSSLPASFVLQSPASGIIGSPIDWAENQDVINLGIPDGGAVSVNPDLLGGLDLSNIATDKVIGLGDYLDALADAINGLSDRVIDLHDALALDDVIALPIPDELTPGITVPVDPAITVPDTSVNVIEGTKPADPSDPSNPLNPDTIIANYSYDLTSVFPFCIPFDIVRALEKLNATPEAPAFSYRFKYTAIGLDYTLSVDLSAWDSVAAVLRTMEVLLFTIGLGLVSRKLIMA